MPRALKVCSCLGCAAHEGSCPEAIPQGRCAACRRVADLKRGTAAQRGYNGRGHKSFRAAVLRRDPVCVIEGCNQPSTDADHWPISKRDLDRLGLNSNDPNRGRGLCRRHHNQATAVNQPGGWGKR